MTAEQLFNIDFNDALNELFESPIQIVDEQSEYLAKVQYYYLNSQIELNYLTDYLLDYGLTFNEILFNLIDSDYFAEYHF